MDLSTFVLVGNNRQEAYIAHMDFELGFDSPDIMDLLTFQDFCQELDLGYDKSEHIQIARLYEDDKGKIWYNNEYYR